MGHDQVVVETAFRYPKVPGHKSPQSPLSENLDGQLLHMESKQYRNYVEEYSKLQLEREIELRRLKQD